MFSTTLIVGLSTVSIALGHMALDYPAAFRAAKNPNVNQNAIDYTPTAPLSGAAQFPCKGYLTDLGTPAGKATASWAAGGSYNFTVQGSAVHGGGSCQAALSYDSGKTWKVIHSYLGSCPLADGEAFDFTVPSDAPAGSSVVFTWLWYNVVGNREIYMSCASVDITSASAARAAPAVPFSSRPDLFLANLGNGCTTVEGKEVQFPNPGPDVDVTTKDSIADNSGSFTGTCAAVDGVGGESGSSPVAASGGASSATSPVASSPAASSPATSQQPTSSSAPMPNSLSVTIPTASPGVQLSTVSVKTSVTTFTTKTMSNSVSSKASSSGDGITIIPIESPTVTVTSTPTSFAGAPAASGTGSSPSGLTVSADGECSGVHTCEGSIHGPCCSTWGWCGSTDAYCGNGCQSGFGQCGTFLNTTSSVQAKVAGDLKKPFKIRGGP